MCAPGHAEGGLAREVVGQDGADGQPGAQPAVLLGHVGGEQAQRTGLLDQRAHQARLLGVDLLHARQHLAGDKRVRRLGHQPLLVAEAFG